MYRIYLVYVVSLKLITDIFSSCACKLCKQYFIAQDYVKQQALNSRTRKLLSNQSNNSLTNGRLLSTERKEIAQDSSGIEQTVATSSDSGEPVGRTSSDGSVRGRARQGGAHSSVVRDGLPEESVSLEGNQLLLAALRLDVGTKKNRMFKCRGGNWRISSRRRLQDYLFI